MPSGHFVAATTTTKASLDSEGNDELVDSPKRRMPGATGKAEEQQERSFHALLPFLQTQSQTSLTRLYQRPSSCLSIFRYARMLSYVPFRTCPDSICKPFGSRGTATCHESSVARVIHSDCYNVFLGNKRRKNVGVISTFPFG